LLQVCLDAVLLQTGIDPELVLAVVQHLFDRDDQPIAGFGVRDGPYPNTMLVDVLNGATWWTHPIEGLVRTVVGVDGHGSVSLDEDQSSRHG
jgi:hypothetical protein